MLHFSDAANLLQGAHASDVVDPLHVIDEKASEPKASRAVLDAHEHVYVPSADGVGSSYRPKWSAAAADLFDSAA